VQQSYYALDALTMSLQMLEKEKEEGNKNKNKIGKGMSIKFKNIMQLRTAK